MKIKIGNGVLGGELQTSEILAIPTRCSYMALFGTGKIRWRKTVEISLHTCNTRLKLVEGFLSVRVAWRVLSTNTSSTKFSGVAADLYLANQVKLIWRQTGIQ